MTDKKQLFRVVVSVLLIVLLLGMTSGMAWHHHANHSAETCPICHLAIAPAVTGVRTCVLVPVGAGPGHQPTRSLACAALRQVPARAPPA
jgi:hypothetical protein